MKTILVCNHSLDGWCLACVKLLAEKADQMIGDLEEQVSKEHMDWVELRNNYNTVERQRDKARSRVEAAEAEVADLKTTLQDFEADQAAEDKIDELMIQNTALQAEVQAVRYALNCEGNPVNAIESLYAERDRLQAEVARLTETVSRQAQDYGTSEQLRQADTRIAELEAEVRNFAENFDCDMDAHRLGTHCRACRAKALLGEGK